MLALHKPGPHSPHLESVRPALLAMEPAFLTAHLPRVKAERNVRDEADLAQAPCPGCGRVHRDRLVRFFQVRWAPVRAHEPPSFRSGSPVPSATLTYTPHLAGFPRMARAERPVAEASGLA